MKLLKIELQGYRSFQAPAVIDFAAMCPGLYHVQGRNEVEPELEANGAGKSSLFEAPHWCLFGKTSEGVRASAVKSWDGDEQCVVATDWETPSGTMSLMRAWGPNELAICEGVGDPRPIAQDEIDARFMSQSVYRFSILFAQFAPTFIDLSPADQSAVFTDVLSLKIWEQAAEVARTDITKLELILRMLAEDRAGIVGQLTELADASYDEQEHNWNVIHREDIQSAQTQLVHAEKDETKCRVRLGEARVAVVEYRELAAKEQDMFRKMDGIENVEVRLKKEIKELQDNSSDVCPTCGAKLTNRKHIEKEITTKKKELLALKVKVMDARTAHQVANIKLTKAAGKNTVLLEAEKSYAVAKASVRILDAKLADIQVTENPYTKLRQEADTRAEALLAELEGIDAHLGGANAQVAATGYWVKGFKEIRLSLINESLSQLTIEANEVLYQMGLQDWHIEFDVERETKSGTINKNFTVMIHSPHTDATVPWEAWSGGEKQRLRLAITMGFANLVSSRAGVQPNVEMWDEPSTGLSEAGIQDMLEVLAERAQRYSRVVLLADHRALDFGGFAGVITVVKDDKGSRIDGVPMQVQKTS